MFREGEVIQHFSGDCEEKGARFQELRGKKGNQIGIRAEMCGD